MVINGIKKFLGLNLIEKDIVQTLIINAMG
jgi:hypothetical protein